MLKLKRNLKILFLTIFTSITIAGSPQFFYKNSEYSQSHGRVSSGSIENSWLLPRKGRNYKYFSLFNYYVIGRAYVNSDVYHIMTKTYHELESIAPGKKFRYMECSRKKGGRAWPHKTHQNGLSVDFMTPLKKKGKQKKIYDCIGSFRYLMNFNSSGKAKINDKVSIDFELIAIHIITLDEIAHTHNMKIKKVILSTHLQDELYKTKYSKKLKSRAIYLTKNLTPMLNKLHDDHYHIDFTFLN